ncbi:MAG: hypothetical protein EA376_00400 [Phycisphaeraceae bacterium]|nr:MAG: hypothetical protein EA376_00400 [Phycisphaeraceae bacterium]
MSYRNGTVILRAAPVGVALAAVCAMALLTGTGCRSNRDGRPEAQFDQTPVTRIFTPEWYDAAPIEEEGRIRKTAQGVGASPTMAESLAINQARQEMALAIDARVDVLQRNFQEQVQTSAGPELLQRFQDVNAVVASRSLHGSHVVRKETYIESDGQYRTFVLMELDGREVDERYLNSLRGIEALETRLRSSEAWAELERRALELREERRSGGPRPMTDEEIRGDR